MSGRAQGRLDAPCKRPCSSCACLLFASRSAPTSCRRCRKSSASMPWRSASGIQRRQSRWGGAGQAGTAVCACGPFLGGWPQARLGHLKWPTQAWRRLAQSMSQHH